MSILWSLLIGLIAGALAKAVMPGKDPGGIIVTILLGMAGALVAFLIGRSMGFYSGHEQGPGIIASILGAVLILGVYRLFMRRRRSTI
jgi:uncharacterized membrane protein YeaQ/YmgE (transglycosylase-associated protein family)